MELYGLLQSLSLTVRWTTFFLPRNLITLKV